MGNPIGNTDNASCRQNPPCPHRHSSICIVYNASCRVGQEEEASKQHDKFLEHENSLHKPHSMGVQYIHISMGCLKPGHPDSSHSSGEVCRNGDGDILVYYT
jgi:hypothetical protein